MATFLRISAVVASRPGFHRGIKRSIGRDVNHHHGDVTCALAQSCQEEDGPGHVYAQSRLQSCTGDAEGAAAEYSSAVAGSAKGRAVGDWSVAT